MCGEAVCFVRSLKKWTIGVFFVTPWHCTFLFTDSWYIKLTPWQANAMGAAMFVSYPTAPLCKTQHDWLTASQHPLRFQKCGPAFQNLMNISTLSNALVNIREELRLADSDIPPLRKKCSGQAGLPGSLPCTVCWDPGWRGCHYRDDKFMVAFYISDRRERKIFSSDESAGTVRGKGPDMIDMAPCMMLNSQPSVNQDTQNGQQT